jgi:hypothetical protein
MIKWFELGIATHMIKEQYDMEWWTHNHKEISLNMELKIMVIKHLVMDKK